MKKVLKSLLILLLMASFAVAQERDINYLNQPGVEQRGERAAALLLENLQSALQGALKEGGPLHAVSFCSLEALGLTEKVTQQVKGIREVKRATLLPRNPKNRADLFEEQAIKIFATEPNRKSLLQPDVDGLVRYYRPIKMQPVCLTCHGPKQSLLPELAAKLEELYPRDQATGYQLGDLRGVIRISVEK